MHEAWAIRAGVSADELERIGAGELAVIPADQRAAIVYATALAESRFGPIPYDVRVLADAHLDRERQRDIEVIARLMTFANLSVNSLHRPWGTTERKVTLSSVEHAAHNSALRPLSGRLSRGGGK